MVRFVSQNKSVSFLFCFCISPSNITICYHLSFATCRYSFGECLINATVDNISFALAERMHSACILQSRSRKVVADPRPHSPFSEIWQNLSVFGRICKLPGSQLCQFDDLLIRRVSALLSVLLVRRNFFGVEFCYCYHRILGIFQRLGISNPGDRIPGSLSVSTADRP